MRLEDGALRMGPLEEAETAELLSVKKAIVCKPREPSSRIKTASALIWIFQCSELWEINICCLSTQSVVICYTSHELRHYYGQEAGRIATETTYHRDGGKQRAQHSWIMEKSTRYKGKWLGKGNSQGRRQVKKYLFYKRGYNIDGASRIVTGTYEGI